jgi:D-alanyl-lipoteichoic acid acyltransferase DltB (MBOAT superfamily)
VLLIISLAFYAISDPNWMILLVFSIFWIYFFGKLISKATSDLHKSILVGIAVAGQLGVLIFGKYFNLIVETGLFFSSLANLEFSGDVTRLILPFGISYYSFKAISYLVDVKRSKYKPGGLLQIANFLSFFPQIGAGPIQRFDTFKPGEYSYELPKIFSLILSATLKKFVIASILFEVLLEVFRIPSNFSSLDLLLSGFIYWAFIYADFSGYTDYAIAFSRLLGVNSPDNFNSPFKARSLRDFWSRWHITLSNWLRDYLYIPLGGNRSHHFFNLFITMVLGGIWHGASWNFLLWGAFHGVGLIINHIFRDRINFGLLGNLFTQVITWIFVSFSWVLFAITDFQVLSEYITSINANWNLASQLLSPLTILLIGLVLIINYFGDKCTNILNSLFNKLPFLLSVTLFLILLFVLIILGPDETPAFVYFSF